MNLSYSNASMRKPKNVDKSPCGKVFQCKAHRPQALQPNPTPRIKPVHPRSLNLQPDCITGSGLRLR